MKAIFVEKEDDSYQLSYKDVPIPTPKEGQIVIKHHFIGKYHQSLQHASTIVTDTCIIQG